MDRTGFGDHLRRWRRARGLSQIDLAALAGVSARHISFLETGRAQPSREMVLKLAQSLAVPLRERNPMRPALQSVRTVLAAHMPHPALDRLYHVVEANVLGQTAPPLENGQSDRCACSGTFR